MNEEYKETRNVREKIININGLTVYTRKGLYDANIISHELQSNMYNIKDNFNTIIDIGAHIGGTTLYAAKKGITVYAIEPDPTNYKMLLKNIESNNLEDKVVSINEACGVEGIRKFYIHGSNSGVAGLKGNPARAGVHEEISVKVSTLDSLIEKYNIKHCDLLKIDCEGAEYEILFGLDPKYFTIIDSIVLEVHKIDNFDFISVLLKYIHRYYSNFRKINKTVYEFSR